MAFKLVVSDPKTRHSYQREAGEEGIIGKKIGEKVSGSLVGLEGYELQITGGSDKDGFPMRRDVEGTARKKILISAPPGFHPKSGGMRKRKSVRGNTVSGDIVQINTKVVKYGNKALAQLLGTKKKEEKSAEKPEEKKEPEAGHEEAAEKKPEPAEGKEGKPPEKADEEKPHEEPAETEKPEPKEEEAGGEKPAEPAAETEKKEEKPKE